MIHLRRILADLWRSSHGAIAVFMALVLTVLIGVAALGIEISGWYATKRDLQRIADTSAIEAAFTYNSKTDTSVAFNAAARAAVANGATVGVGGSCTGSSVSSCTYSGGSQSLVVSYTSATGKFSAALTSSEQRMLSGIFGSGNVSVAASGAAKIQASDSACVIGLDACTCPGNGDVVRTSGGASLDSTGCAVQSNCDVNTNGGASITASSVYASGVIESGSSLSTDSPSSEHQKSGASAVSDPYSSKGWLFSSACSCSSSTTVDADASPPSTCTGKWDLKNNDDVVLTSGQTYCVNGDFEMSGSSTLNGSGATIIVKGQIKVTGGTMSLTAPSSGTYAGLAISSEYNGSCSQANTLTGNSGVSITGLIYSPNAELKIRGSAATGSTNECMLLVAKSIDIAGHSTAMSTDCSAYGLTLPLVGGGGVALVD